MRYDNQPIGEPGSSAQESDLQAIWAYLANEYKGNPYVIFGVMNEPYSTSSDTLDTPTFIADTEAAVKGILSTGATNKILISGSGWTNMYGWCSGWWNGGSDPYCATPGATVPPTVDCSQLPGDFGANSTYGEANSCVIYKIVSDLKNSTSAPLNLGIDVHEYFSGNDQGQGPGGDGGNSVTTPCVPADQVVSIENGVLFTNWITNLNNWLHTNIQAFVTEFGGTPDSSCVATLNQFLTFIEQNPNQFMGWSTWAAGAFTDSYALNLNPDGSVDKPQMQGIDPHLTPLATD